MDYKQGIFKMMPIDLINEIRKYVGVALKINNSIFLNDASKQFIESKTKDSSNLIKYINVNDLKYEIKVLGNNFKYPMSLYQDRYNNIIVADTDNLRLSIYNYEYKFIKNIPINDLKCTMTGVIVNIKNEYVVTFHDIGIIFFNSIGQKIREIKSRGCQAICIGPDDNLYVANSYKHTIDVYDQVGKFICSLKDNDKRIYSPHGINFDYKNKILVTNRYNDNIAVFNKKGKYKRVFSTWKSSIESIGIFTDRNGLIFVSDTRNKSILILNSDYKVVHYIKVTEAKSIYGLIVDHNGNIVFTDPISNTVYILKITM